MNNISNIHRDIHGGICHYHYPDYSTTIKDLLQHGNRNDMPSQLGVRQ